MMNKYTTVKNIFLKICYFSFLLMLLSCKGETAKKEETKVDTNKTTETSTSEKESTKKIVFFGDSLTAGYGLDDVDDAFPGLIQQSIDSLEFISHSLSILENQSSNKSASNNYILSVSENGYGKRSTCKD